MPRNYVKKADRVPAETPDAVELDVSTDMTVEAEAPDAFGSPDDTPGADTPVALTFSQWRELISTLQNNKQLDHELAADLHARAMKKALRPETDWPGTSHYNPLGEVAFPRPRPSHIYMLGPYPIADPGNYDTVTRLELELLDQLRPGDYRVTKLDGQDVLVTIQTDMASNGITPYRTTILMPMKDDDEKQNWPPLAQLLSQVTTGEAPAQSFTRMEARIKELEAKLATTAA